jgi:hypothetical protein
LNRLEPWRTSVRRAPGCTGRGRRKHASSRRATTSSQFIARPRDCSPFVTYDRHRSRSASPAHRWRPIMEIAAVLMMASVVLGVFLQVDSLSA